MDNLLLAPDSSSFNLLDRIIQFGDSPLLVMGWLLTHGAWIVLIWIVLWGLRELWLDARQAKFMRAQTFVVLAIDVPRATEQTVKAVENMFAHLAGAHSEPTFLEKWIDGKVQTVLSCEIISIEGHVQFLIRCVNKARDLVEASIYAQYPDAEITEVEDYTARAPKRFPDEAYDCFAFEFTPVKAGRDVYPLKTYMDFEHQLTSEFKDPVAVLLETLARLGPGEQLWYQILVKPIAQTDFVAKVTKEVKKVTGQKEPVKKNVVDKALDLPITALGMAGDVVFGAGGAPVKKKDENALNSRMWNLTPGERKLVESLERKMSKIAFQVKIRVVYLAKKEAFNKAKVGYSIVGAMKQYNSNDALALKPEGKRVGVSSTMIFMKERRNNVRKGKLIRAYANRSSWVGLPTFFLNTEELASLWHLPVSLFVKAPQVKKTESKKTEPPINLPFG